MIPEEARYETGRPMLNCLRCQTVLDFSGVTGFTEVAAWQRALFDGRKEFEVYVCPRCGKAELFARGTGV